MESPPVLSSPRTDGQLRAMLASLPHDRDAFHHACRDVSDWRELLSAARWHGVAGVVLAGAEWANIALGQAALGAADELRPETVWLDVLRDTLHSVLNALAADGVTAVALKGPLLAARLYDDEALRPSTDLDLLVDPASLDAAIEALKPLGYALEGGKVGRFFRDHHHHVHALHPTLPVVELHFDAYRGFGTVLPAAPLIARSIPCGVPGWGDARVLAPEDEFLYLAVHAAGHRFSHLVWLFDLKLMALRHPGLRWDLLAARADTQRLSAVVAFACRLLSNWLGTACGGAPHLPPLSETRSLAAECLARPRSIHLVNAAADFLFCALLCDDPARAAAYAGRFVQIKVLYDAPIRARALFSA